MKNETRPLRIAHVIGKMMSGGVEAIVMNYFSCVDRTRVQFDFIVDADSETVPEREIKALGGRVFYVPPYQQPLRYHQELLQLFRAQQYPIVHAHINSLSVFPLYAAFCAGVPIRIAHSHSTAGEGEPLRNLIKTTLRPVSRWFPTAYCACSHKAGEWLFGKRQMEKDAVRIWPNAIHLDRFLYSEQTRETLRQRMGLQGRFVVGHVGRFVHQKNHAFLIDIFAAIQRLKPSAMLLLIGDGELLPQVKTRVNALGLADNVRFLGVRQDVSALYQAMDVVVLPSFYEGLPVVGVEAQAAGLPCICADTITQEAGVLPTTRFLSLQQSAEMWARAVVSVQGRRDPLAGEAMQEAGFALEKSAERLMQYYEGLYEKTLWEQKSRRSVLGQLARGEQRL